MINWVLLSNTMLGNFLAGAAARIFAISLPTVAQGLKTDILGISWALLSYELSAISLSVVFGRIGDIYGRQIVYGVGLLLLTLSSFLCGVSQTIFQLILFRLLQGVAGAMTQSTGRALAIEAVPEGSEGKSQGLMTMAFAAGSFLGPSLGGFIIDYIHWRGVFFFLVPIGATGAFLTFSNPGLGKVPGSLDRSSSKPRIDYLGAVLLILATAALMALLNQKVMEWMEPIHRAVLFVVFFGLILGFTYRERVAESPIVNFALFRIRMFVFSSVSLLLISVTHGLTYFVLPFYLQDILHLSPSFIGVLFMATPFFTLTLSTGAAYVSDRIGPRLPATLGVIIHIASLLLGTTLKVESHWILPAGVLALAGLGNAFFLSPNHTAMIGSVPRGHRGFATGSLHLMFSLGIILGISLGTFLMTRLFRFYTGLPTAVPTPLQPLAFVSSLNAVYSVGVGLGVAALFTSVMRGARPPGSPGAGRD